MAFAKSEGCQPDKGGDKTKGNPERCEGAKKGGQRHGG